MRLYFGNYYTIYDGTVSNKNFVKHQACCIVISNAKKIKLTTANLTTIYSDFFVIPSMNLHKIEYNTACFFIFLEPYLDFSKQHTIISTELKSDYLSVQNVLKKIFQSNLVRFDARDIDNYFHKTASIDDRINVAIAFINNNLGESLTTKQIAHYTCLSESRLQHLFKSNVGIPIRKYIHWQRIVTACKNVVNGMNLITAAYESGFSDAAHLSRQFSKMFGLPPSIIFKK